MTKDIISEVYNMDCIAGMKEYPDNYFDLAIVDVPYGIGEDGSKNHTRSVIAKSKNYKAFYGNDLQPPNLDYWEELFRVSKNQIVWGANHFISKLPYDSPCWIVWNKDNGATDFADCELAWTSFKTAVRKFDFKWQGMLQQDMKNKEQRIHPTQKPIKLYEWILMNYAKEGDKILDTHGGSMSSVIACLKGGYNITCFEIDREYYNKGKKRIEAFISQGNLFMEKPEIKFIDTCSTK